MVSEICREMIEDSPIAYAKIKINKIEENFILYKILDENKAYKKFKENYDLSIEDLIFNKNIDYNYILSESQKNKKHSLKTYFEKYKLYINIKIYYGGNNEFYIRINEFDIHSTKISSITRNSPYLAWIKDKDGKYIDVSNKYLETCNMEYAKIIGKTDYDIWIKEEAETFQNQDKLVIQNNKQYSFEEKIYLNEKKYGYFHTIKWPLKDKFDTIIGTIGISLEIDDKIELRTNIEKNEKFFQEISNNIEDIIIIRDEEKILYVNDYFEKIFGFKPDILYEDINKWHDEWENIKIIDGTVDYKYNKLSKNIARIRNKKFDKWIQSKFIPVFDEDGNIIRKVGIISDITKTKELEERLESLRIDFFANLSHEIRTPITLILSSLQLLSSKINKLEENNDDYNKYLSIIKQNSYRLLKLVNNLLDTTQINNGNFTYRPQNYDIVSFVENICMAASDFVKVNNMNIVFDTDEEEKIISFDLDNMERIILNLLSNAIKYGSDNGKIEVTINCTKDVRISVKDNGIGIPKDKQNRVFERFGQVKNKMHTEWEGSGIGLFLVKSLVELNGGEIILNSELGKGSEFIIVLPDKIENNEITKLTEFKNKLDTMNIEFSDIYI